VFFTAVDEHSSNSITAVAATKPPNASAK